MKHLNKALFVMLLGVVCTPSFAVEAPCTKVMAIKITEGPTLVSTGSLVTKCGGEASYQIGRAHSYVKTTTPTKQDVALTPDVLHSGWHVVWKDGGHLDITNTAVTYVQGIGGNPGEYDAKMPRVSKEQIIVPGVLPAAMDIPLGQYVVSYSIQKSANTSDGDQ